MPAVKLVAVLRNPTDRALSHYFHNVRNNDLRAFREELRPAEAMAAEEERLAPIARGAATTATRLYRVASYKARGRYLEQLAPLHATSSRARTCSCSAPRISSPIRSGRWACSPTSSASTPPSAGSTSSR